VGSFLIVDGYNIINSWTSLKDLANHNMEEARDKLIEILASYRAYKGIEIFLVFDAQLVKGSLGKEETINGIKVVFTKEHQTADSYIEKQVHSLSRLNLVQVATSDWAEQQTIFSSGGIRMTARELEAEVNFAEKNMKKKYIDKKINNHELSHRLEPHILKKLEQWRKKKD
jgi:hypothetical protein